MVYGMSQTGADSLAKQGYNYENIIKHYYSGVEIENIE
jgi:stage II sporulation protein D